MYNLINGSSVVIVHNFLGAFQNSEVWIKGVSPVHKAQDKIHSLLPMPLAGMNSKR